MKLPKTEQLTQTERIVGALLAVVLAAIAFVVLYRPPTKSITETSGAGGKTHVIQESQDSTNPFVALFLGGLVVFVFSLNGLRLSKISAAGVSAESPDAGKAAQEFYETEVEDRAEEEVTVPNKDSPEPVDPPIRYVEQDDKRYAVYSLEAVPASVMGDALSNWPEGTKPAVMGSFEFASRRTGRGNHPWTVKFKGNRAVTVSYGGYGKKTATVGPAP